MIKDAGMCGSEALNPPPGDELVAKATNPKKASAQIAYCVSATSETPISLPIRSVNERTDAHEARLDRHAQDRPGQPVVADAPARARVTGASP